MKHNLKLTALALAIYTLSGCAVNFVAVKVEGSEVAYLDNGVSETVNESNLASQNH